MGQASGMSSIHHEHAFVKLTRTLAITGVRDDGYHLIESEMVTLDVGDDLEITSIDDGPSELEVIDEVPWIGPGSSEPTPVVPRGPDNLVMRALTLTGRTARVRLVKRTPAGAGLGGGSADAAAVLRWAALSDPRALDGAAASQLGADVPFCIRGGRAKVSGIGEIIEPLATDDATYVLCTPSWGVNTAEVYRAYDELTQRPKDARELRSTLAGPNALTGAALVVEPRLARLRDLFAEVAGRLPVLAGSGSTWYLETTPSQAKGLEEDLVAAISEAGWRAAVRTGRTTLPAGPAAL